MDVPNREQVEARLARLVSREMQSQLGNLLDLLGDPPDISKVTEAYWNNGGKQLRAIIEPELAAIFMAQAELIMRDVGVGVDWALVNQQAVDFASTYTFDLVTSITGKNKELLQKAIASFFDDGLSLGQLRDMISPAFGPVRSELIGITEVTRASVAGERTLAERIMAENPFIRMVGYWITERDGRVCEICAPNDGHLVDEVGYPPAHPRCRCTIRYEMRAKE